MDQKEIVEEVRRKSALIQRVNSFLRVQYLIFVKSFSTVDAKENVTQIDLNEVFKFIGLQMGSPEVYHPQNY